MRPTRYLGDPQKKAQYDQVGHAEFRPGDAASYRPPSYDDLFRDFGLGDIFDAFSGGSRKTRRRAGADLRYDLEISLTDAFYGTKNTVAVPHQSECQACHGTGAQPGSMRDCPTCRGTGEIRSSRKAGGRPVINIAPCPDCGGSGKIIENPARPARERVLQKTRRIEITIPRGVEDGQFLRIAGEGEPGENHGPPGDLYAVVHVKKHDIFERQGADLYTTAVVGLPTALLGGRSVCRQSPGVRS